MTYLLLLSHLFPPLASLLFHLKIQSMRLYKGFCISYSFSSEIFFLHMPVWSCLSHFFQAYVQMLERLLCRIPKPHSHHTLQLPYSALCLSLSLPIYLYLFIYKYTHTTYTYYHTHTHTHTCLFSICHFSFK